MSLLLLSGNNEIDFRTLVQGLVLVSGKIGEDEKVQLVFEIYDMDHDGKVRVDTCTWR